MRRKKIAAVLLMVLMGMAIPVAGLLAGFRALIIGNFAFYFDDEQFIKTFDWLWTKRLDAILEWAAKPQPQKRAEPYIPQRERPPFFPFS